MTAKYSTFSDLIDHTYLPRLKDLLPDCPAGMQLQFAVYLAHIHMTSSESTRDYCRRTLESVIDFLYCSYMTDPDQYGALHDMLREAFRSNTNITEV